MPFFSIIIPTYNRASLLGKTIESVLQQRFTDFELIIVDDGSTDNTTAVVQPFTTDPRVTYHKKKNGERGAARNFGSSIARGTYINFFDSDDLMYPNHLEVASEFIQQNQHPAIFHLGYDYKMPDGKMIYIRNSFSEESTRVMLFDNILSCNGVFLQQEIALKFPFEEDRTMASAEDWALWIRLASRYQIKYSNAITSAIIAHDARSIRTINIEKVIERDLFLISHLRADPVAIDFYQGKFDTFIAQRFTFFMMCFAGQKQRRKVFYWAGKALKAYPLIFFTKRFLAAIKNTIR